MFFIRPYQLQNKNFRRFLFIREKYSEIDERSALYMPCVRVETFANRHTQNFRKTSLCI